MNCFRLPSDYHVAKISWPIILFSFSMTSFSQEESNPSTLTLDIDGNGQYDALTDGLLLLRGMFGLDGEPLITGAIASNADYKSAVDIESRIEKLGDLADIDGDGQIDALTDGLLTLRYLFGLEGVRWLTVL